MKNSDHANIDEWLDSTLGSYSQAEPRAGLESRIVAQLRAAPPLPRWRVKFAYAGAAMVTMCVMACGIWCVEVLKTAISVPAPISMVHLRSTPLAGTKSSGSERRTPPHASVTARRKEKSEPQAEAVLGLQMPAPQPLSPPEKLLFAFARENPKEVMSTIAWQEEMRRPAQPESPEQGEQQ